MPIKENKEKLKNLSQHPGVYQMLDKNQQVIYIGKGKKTLKKECLVILVNNIQMEKPGL